MQEDDAVSEHSDGMPAALFGSSPPELTDALQEIIDSPIARDAPTTHGTAEVAGGEEVTHIEQANSNGVDIEVVLDADDDGEAGFGDEEYVDIAAGQGRWKIDHAMGGHQLDGRRCCHRVD